MYCGSCGQKAQDGEKFCGNCGLMLEEDRDEQELEDLFSVQMSTAEETVSIQTQQICEKPAKKKRGKKNSINKTKKEDYKKSEKIEAEYATRKKSDIAVTLVVVMGLVLLVATVVILLFKFTPENSVSEESESNDSKQSIPSFTVDYEYEVYEPSEDYSQDDYYDYYSGYYEDDYNGVEREPNWQGDFGSFGQAEFEF